MRRKLPKINSPEAEDWCLLRCTGCKRLKPQSDFDKDNSRVSRKFSYYCKACKAIWSRQNRKKNFAVYKRVRRQRQNRIEAVVLAHYGNGKLSCVKCGFNDIRVLSIDHIDGGGCKHKAQIDRQGYQLYKWLQEENYPIGYQTLCLNCQFIKQAENGEYARDIK